jgi:60 kDa SS-A/Ro ribonucleoprotein
MPPSASSRSTPFVLTDGETWAGPIHPAQALRAYREQSGLPSRLIVVGLVSNGFSIADPDDAGMLDAVGFDASAPEVMSGFSRGEF